jgi:hypothetical protein
MIMTRLLTQAEFGAKRGDPDLRFTSTRTIAGNEPTAGATRRNKNQHGATKSHNIDVSTCAKQSHRIVNRVPLHGVSGFRRREIAGAEQTQFSDPREPDLRG